MKILLIIVTALTLFGNDFSREVSMKSGFENTNNDLSSQQNIQFIKRAAII